MRKFIRIACLILFFFTGLNGEIPLNINTDKESGYKMFAVIYQGYLKEDREHDYREAWNQVARYFIEHRGAIGSCLHKTSEGLWVAYSRWPSKEMRDHAWPGENGPSTELPDEIRRAVLTIKECLDSEREISELCLEVVDDLLLLE